jgi:hypothetical protein
VIDEPENQTDGDADDHARDQRKIKRAVFPAMEYIAGKAAQAEGKFAGEREKRADGYEDCAEDEKGSAEMLERLHGMIVASGGQEGKEAAMTGSNEEQRLQSWFEATSPEVQVKGEESDGWRGVPPPCF